jgi:multisubunit Na+/H+ antiporter MnhB subunit
MPVATILEIVLAAVVLGLGVWTIAARETYAATVGYVAYVLLVPLVWVRLDAIDVALTEAAIGGGLGGVLLLGAAARLRATENASAAETPGRTVRLGAAALSVMISAALAAAILHLPDPAPTLAPAAVANASATSLANPVTNVLMAFHAMDTMLEKVVLLLAIVGVWSLASDWAWGGRPGPRHQAEPRGALAFLARLLPPVGIVVGIYILWTGADRPGGAFQGGANSRGHVAAGHLGRTDGHTTCEQQMAAAPPRRRARRLPYRRSGRAPFWSGIPAYPPAYAKPLILIVEIAMTLTIAVTLGLLLAGAQERSAQR